MKRIEYLDGLRGIAILSVIGYHAFARWPGLVPMPYGQRFAPYFGWGWLGVELFFIISGFVIFLTLDKCRSFGEFMGKRWLRLFPAMLIASCLIVATAPLVNRPSGIPNMVQILPGLTFIDEGWLGVHSLEGTFWSLYAEMKFYVFAGLLYFAFGRRAAIYGLIGGFAVYWMSKPFDGLHWLAYQLSMNYWAWFACGALFYEWTLAVREAVDAPQPTRLTDDMRNPVRIAEIMAVPARLLANGKPPFSTVLGLRVIDDHSLDVAGHESVLRILVAPIIGRLARAYDALSARLDMLIETDRADDRSNSDNGAHDVFSHAPRLARFLLQNKLFTAALTMGLLASLFPPPGGRNAPNLTFFPLIGFGFVLLFAIALTNERAQKLLSNPILLFVGFISYPLYLIHEQALIGLTQLFGNVFVPLGLIMGAAWVIAKHCERPVKFLLVRPVWTRASDACE